MRLKIILALTAVVVAASTVTVIALRPQPSPWLETLERAARAAETQSFRGTIDTSNPDREKSFEAKFEITHHAGGETHIGIKSVNRGGKGWRPPGPWHRRGERGTWKRSRGGSDRPSGRGRRGGPWWRSIDRNFLRPVIDPQRAVENYTIREAPAERIAGRDARRLEFTPIVEGRPTTTLWLDRDTGVALGLTVADPSGATISRWRYESFEPGTFEIPEEDSPGHRVRRGAGARSLELEDLRERPPFDVWIPQRLPAGYGFHSAGVTSRGSTSKITLSYTDGMSVIVISETVGGRRRTRPDNQTRGDRPVVHRVKLHGTTMLMTNLGQTGIRVMGTVPAEELTEVVRSMIQHKKQRPRKNVRGYSYATVDFIFWGKP